jgi:hypothetical protein
VLNEVFVESEKGNPKSSRRDRAEERSSGVDTGKGRAAAAAGGNKQNPFQRLKAQLGITLRFIHILR